MHSTGVLSSLLVVAAVAYAAPAAPSASSSSAYSQSSSSVSATYTESVLKTSSTVASHSSTPTYAASSSAAKPSPSYEGKTGTDTGSNKATYDAALPAVVAVNTRAGNADLINKLLSVSTQGDRQRLLDQPGDYVFDFNDANAPEGSEAVGKGGFSVAATAKTMPALIGLDSSQTLGFLGPCGFNTPHVHNRATELNTVVQGRLVTNFVGENGVKAVENTVSKFQMAVFPQGAIHAEFNPDCEDAVFVASFNNADPGVTQIAQGFFNLRPDGVAATLGGVSQVNGADIESFRDLIPANVALGVDSCLKKCNINRNAKRDLSEFMESA